MTTILATVIFLLADGTPARDAWVSCSHVSVYEAGTDNRLSMPQGTPLLLDSRGAVIMQLPKPTTITCDAWQGAQSWNGPIALVNKAVEKVWLK